MFLEQQISIRMIYDGSCSNEETAVMAVKIQLCHRQE